MSDELKNDEELKLEYAEQLRKQFLRSLAVRGEMDEACTKFDTEEVRKYASLVRDMSNELAAKIEEQS